MIVHVECNDGESQYIRVEFPSTDNKTLNRQVTQFQDTNIFAEHLRGDLYFLP